MSAELAARPVLKERVVPPEEWPALFGEVEPFKSSGMPNPAGTRVVVLEDEEGQIAAFWFATVAVHLEPVWIAPAFRGNVGLVRRLWRKLRQVLEEAEVGSGFAVIGMDASQEALRPAMGLGFERVHGDLYWIDLTKGRE